jgi:hypothetical protein
MRKYLLILLFVLSIHFAKAQHYTQGIAFDTTLASGHFALSGACMQTFQFKMQLDTSLFNYVAGMKFIAVFDTVTGMMAGGGTFGNIQSGDTVELNTAHPVFAPLGSYSCWYRLKLIGTPQTSGQIYPCEIDLLQCTCACTDMTITKSTFNSSICSVDVFNAINEKEKNTISIYPNPAIHSLSIGGITSHSLVSLYDAFGKLISQKETDNNTIFDTTPLLEGMYTLEIANDKNKSYHKIVIAK